MPTCRVSEVEPSSIHPEDTQSSRKSDGLIRRSFVDGLHWLSSPCTNVRPGRVARRLQQNGAEDGGRRQVAEQSGALGGIFEFRER